MKLVAFLLLTVSAAAADAARDNAWRQDLDTVATELPRRHPNLFFHTPRAVFDQAVSDLRASIPSLSDVEMMLALARIVALPGDAHTSLPLSQRNAAFRLLPLTLRWFDDGLYVVGAGPGYERAAGARVLSIGGVPVEQAYAAVAETISHENDSWARDRSPGSLVNNDILAGLKFAADNLSARFELRDASGETFELEVASATPNIPGPVTPYPDPAGGYTPLWQRQPDVNYWFTYLDSSRTLYFAYNKCAQMATQPFSSFNSALWATFDARPVDRLVIDLRNNVGGDSSVLAPFLTSLSQRAARFRTARAYAIVGKRSFSSAVLNLVDLRQQRVVIAGEPSGGSPSGYGEIQALILPNSRLTVSYSTKLFAIAAAPHGPVLPDVRLPLTSSDYFARHDAFLAATLVDAVSVPPPAPSDVNVLNAAGFRPGPVAPGSLASAFGTWEASTSDVLVNEEPATVLGTFARQINFRVPPDAPLGRSVIQVLRDGAAVASGTFEIASSAPGLFLARAGDGTIELYGTGEGLSALPGRVFVAAEPAEVADFGALPGVPGVWRVAVKLPAGPAGEVPVFLAIGSAASNGVTAQIAK